MNKKPPIWPLRFFRWFCHPDYVEDLEGDLLERFEKSYRSRRLSGWLFTREVLRLFRPGIIRNPGGTKKLNYYGMIRHNLRIGWRSMIRKKSFSFINIIGLSTAASVCLLTFIFYQYETSFDGHHEKAAQIYRVVQETKRPDATLYWGTTAYPLAAALRSDFTHFPLVSQAAGPMEPQIRYVRANTKKVLFEEPFVLFADQQYAQMFDFEWIAGDPNTALLEPNAVVLTQKIAEKCFGKDFDPSDAMGEILQLNSTDPLVVRGIIKNTRPNINLKANMLVSYEYFKNNNAYQAGNWSGNYRGTTFVVLPDEKQRASIEMEINDWKGKYSH